VITPAWRPLSLALAALVLAVAGIALSRSGLFGVRTVTVRGNEHLSAEQVLRRSGLTEGLNAVWMDEAAVEEELEEDPWVQQASVMVDLPWTVHVSVVEREPIAIVQTPTGSALVAGDGTVLGPVRRPRRTTLITAPPPWLRTGAVGDLSGAARALGALAPELRARVERVEITVEGTLEMVLGDGTRISYGVPSGFVPKAAAIDEVLTWAEGSGERVRTISVVAPRAPAVTLA
jgi:cell division protein FtsQ